MKENSRHQLALVALSLTFAAVLIGSLALGRFPVSLPEILRLFSARLFDSTTDLSGPAATILFDVRVPRILAAALIGAALALSGAAYQGLFRNPMVSPDLLGASAGAGFGAALAILLAWNTVLVQASAFGFGLLAVAVAFFIGNAVGKGTQSGIIVLVLAGILVSTIFASCISITKLVADPDNALPAITFWLMGGLSGIRGEHLGRLLLPLLGGAVPLLLLRWKFDILSFGDEEAQSLGVDVRRVRLLVVCCATLLTSASVALCGMIGFVGLVIPHMARLIFGAGHAIVLPASLLLGGIFLILIDDVARCAFPVEIPLGILCSLIGAPVFLYLLVKGRNSWL